jgi:hypothetical protein
MTKMISKGETIQEGWSCGKGIWNAQGWGVYVLLWVQSMEAHIKVEERERWQMAGITEETLKGHEKCAKQRDVFSVVIIVR